MARKFNGVWQKKARYLGVLTIFKQALIFYKLFYITRTKSTSANRINPFNGGSSCNLRCAEKSIDLYRDWE